MTDDGVGDGPNEPIHETVGGARLFAWGILLVLAITAGGFFFLGTVFQHWLAMSK